MTVVAVAVRDSQPRPRTQTRSRTTSALLYDRQLAGLDFERLVLAAAPVLVRRGDGLADDADGRVLRDDPLGDPELTLGLPFGRAIAHRDVDRLARDREMHDELRGFVAGAG